ncbi:cell division protein Sep4a [Cladophialophora carrionii]|uniref:Cell division protein Sep4a n=1 Tax=Cladophialophora carrionii TaxID=86049 RepID=A0A1C1CZS9_9EURO|nr:cell division protein Sep4a [Cladophialophora carrionii]
MTSPAALSRNESQASSRRSTSLGSRLFRSKSGEALGDRKSSAGRLKKKTQDMDESAKVAPSPPRLPNYNPQPLGIQSFGGENYRPRAASREYTNGDTHAPPVPPLPVHMEKEAVDPYARTESMTHRGRYSYANSTVSTINSPRRVRRRKDPTPYNVLIIGARGAGKTSFLNFLKSSLALPSKKQPTRAPDGDTPPSSARPNPSFTHHYQEIDVDGERIGLTLWDSLGLDKSVVDLQLRDMSNFVESKFDDTFIEEMKVVRAPGVRDTHIHCVFFILDPAKLDANINAAQGITSGTETSRIGKPPRIVGALDEDFDIQVIRTLGNKTTVIPVISKADTITTAHMSFLKQKVSRSLKKAGLDPLEALNLDVADSDDERLDERDEDEDSSTADSEEAASARSDDSEGNRNFPNRKRSETHNRQVSGEDASLDSGYVPWSILSPDKYSLESKDGPVGRQFPWGFADPYNPGHCDFVKLKDAVFGEWRSELREASREVFYERWRTNRLNRRTLPSNAANGLPSGPRQSLGGIPIPLQPRVR